jgi:hypothetical protein
MTTYTLRIMMPDHEQLKPEMLASMKGYVLAVEMPMLAQWVGCTNVPSLLDMLGASIGGPMGYAFLTDDDEPSEMEKHWFISVTPGVPWNVPDDVDPVSLGISAVAGALYGHFKLVGAGVPVYLARLAEQGVPTIASREYKVPTTVQEALTLARKQHGKG